MSSSKKNDVISVAPPHSIKKFELISEYVKAWINILMLNKKCRGLCLLTQESTEKAMVIMYSL